MDSLRTLCLTVTNSLSPYFGVCSTNSLVYYWNSHHLITWKPMAQANNQTKLLTNAPITVYAATRKAGSMPSPKSNLTWWTPLMHPLVFPDQTRSISMYHTTNCSPCTPLPRRRNHSCTILNHVTPQGCLGSKGQPPASKSFPIVFF